MSDVVSWDYAFHVEFSAVDLPLKMEMLLIMIFGSWNLQVTGMWYRTGWMHRKRDCKDEKKCSAVVSSGTHETEKKMIHSL